MTTGEIIEAICFIVIELQLLVHTLFSDPLLDVLSMLLLHGSLLFNFNIV